YLVIASGSETNFYGQEVFKNNAYKLDSVEDTKKIKYFLDNDLFDIFIIAGGGYTGVEVATNLRIYFNKIKKDKKIIIAERSNSLLGNLPEKIKNYTLSNLKKLSVDIFLNTTVSKIEGNKIFFSSGEFFNKTMLIWAAGVKTSSFIQKLNLEKNPQGRIKIDDYLKINDNCFVLGDAANFFYKDQPLRMAVQFSIFQARIAAVNIINLILGKPLKKYKPLDLGYIIPMANNKSCGIVLGVYVTGILATFLHYLMCIYRSISWKNKLGIIRNLLNR
ncbi:MAG: FAD-dependent oxidoreductase, partial [Candidatus Omnitrophota bacterium]